MGSSSINTSDKEDSNCIKQSQNNCGNREFVQYDEHLTITCYYKEERGFLNSRTWNIYDMYEKEIGNGLQVLITHIFNPVCFPAVNFILDDRAIKIPTEFLFKKKDVYEFVFLMKENQDKIVFGKDLIDLMNIEFINNGIIIHNKTFEFTINFD